MEPLFLFEEGDIDVERCHSQPRGQDMLRSLCCGRRTVHAYFSVAQPQPLNSKVYVD